MTKDETLDWLYRLKSNIFVYMPKPWLIPMGNALDMAIKALEQQSEWIPCSEQLPKEKILSDGYHEPSDYVLVQMKSGLMHVARYWTRLDSRWLGIPNPTTDKVVAWRELPQPFRGNNK